MESNLSTSPKIRAFNLEREIEQLIESGEFTPEFGYLDFTSKLGPCGCVLAASAVVAGETRPGLTYILLRRTVEDAGIATEHEVRALECAYERWTEESPLYPEFFEAGKRLRRFHP